MQRLVALGTDGQRARRGHPARWSLCSLLLLSLLATAGRAQTPAGTQVSAIAEVTYESAAGLVYTAQSAAVVMTVAQVAGVDLEPPRSTVGDPGVTVVFNHTLANIGNGTDSITCGVTSPLGWPVRLYLDADASGGLNAGDPLVTGPITLAMGDTARLLVAVDVPGSATVRGTTETLDLVATSLFDGSVFDALQDVLQIQDVGILVSLNKSVDRPSATIGDILTYTITYTASGPNTANNFQITDPIPIGTSYVPGSLRWNGSPLTDAGGDDAGLFDVAGNRVQFIIGAITGGDSGTVTFQVRVGG